MNRQEYWREQYRIRNPGWQDSQQVYTEVIRSHVSADTAILDIGCGHTEFLKDVYALTPYTYGIDPDEQAIRKNRVIQEKVVGSAKAMPFPSDFFDLVVMAWVVEHLEHPKEVFREIHRVLKPGGRVIFLTPNTWNYNVWMIRMIPNRFHEFFTRWLYNRLEHDTFPTRYRMNSPARVEYVLAPLGFLREQVICNGDPTYIAFGEPLFHLSCAIERLMSQPRFQNTRVHLIASYSKNARRPAPSRQAIHSHTRQHAPAPLASVT